MRRMFLLTLLISILFSACAGNTNNSQAKFADADSTRPIVIMDNQYGTILFSEGQYNYTVYGKNQKVIEQGTSTKSPEITLLDNNILKFSLQTGTGKSTQWGFYYDIHNDIKSDTMTCVYDEYENKVAYGEKNKIVIRDIFDNSPAGYYFEISSFSPPLSDIVEPILNATFLRDGDEIEVIYFSGDDSNEITQRFSISK